jgi:hypothetical protein
MMEGGSLEHVDCSESFTDCDVWVLYVDVLLSDEYVVSVIRVDWVNVVRVSSS